MPIGYRNEESKKRNLGYEHIFLLLLTLTYSTAITFMHLSFCNKSSWILPAKLDAALFFQKPNKTVQIFLEDSSSDYRMP